MVFPDKEIPKHDPWWDEREDMPDHERWFNFGYETGYSEGRKNLDEDFITNDRLRAKIDSLEALISANYRVLKEEIRKEYESRT